MQPTSATQPNLMQRKLMVEATKHLSDQFTVIPLYKFFFILCKNQQSWQIDHNVRCEMKQYLNNNEATKNLDLDLISQHCRD